jgi:hypothetical protein
MLNYLEFLLKDFDKLPSDLISLRGLFIIDDDSDKFIINTILDTELKAYILPLVNYKLEKHREIDTALDILYLDRITKAFDTVIDNADLKYIFSRHFNPIWRVAAFFCNFLIRADKAYNGTN